MKIMDPFATLQYLGGTTSIHVSMACYALYIFTHVKPDVSCYKGFKHTQLTGMHDKFASDVSLFTDIEWMFGAHCICILTASLENCFKTTSDLGNLAISLFRGVKVWTYLLCLIGVAVAQSQFDMRINLEQDKAHDCPNLQYR
jgi:hypothetical protein